VTSEPRKDQSHLSRAPRALAWSFTNTAASRLGTLGIGIVLARILGPKEFGTYAVAFVALLAVLSFNELGVSLAIVRWPGDPKSIAPTVTTISLLTSLLIAFAGYWLAPWFSDAMGDSSATPVVRLLVMTVVISGAVATPAALLQRQFRQDTRMIIDQVSVWVGAIVSISLALYGSGAMSLAIGRIAGGTVSAVLFIKFSPEPYRLGFDRSNVGALLHFGLPLAGASIIVFAVGYVDQLLVGRTLGSVALGYYVLAFNLSSWPVNMFSQPLRNVAPAAFSRLQHDPESMRSTFRSVVGLLAAVTFPVCMFLAGAAAPLIRLIYGSEWGPAAGALSWLAVLAAFKIGYELCYDYLVVTRASRAILGIQVVTLAVLVPALFLGAKTAGIAGVAALQCAVAAAVVLPLYLTLLRHAGFAPGGLLARLRLPVLASVVVVLIGLGLSQIGRSDVTAILGTGLASLTALLCLVYRDRSELARLRHVVSPPLNAESLHA